MRSFAVAIMALGIGLTSPASSFGAPVGAMPIGQAAEGTSLLQTVQNCNAPSQYICRGTWLWQCRCYPNYWPQFHWVGCAYVMQDYNGCKNGRRR